VVAAIATRSRRRGCFGVDAAARLIRLAITKSERRDLPTNGLLTIEPRSTIVAIAMRLAVVIGVVGDVRRGGDGPDRAAS